MEALVSQPLADLLAEGRDLRGAKLLRQDLRGIDLSGRDLSGANLGGTDLTGANLSGCKLHGASLFGACLDRVRATHADLSDADLSECSAVDAHFGAADLTRAKLSDSNLTGTSLTSARLVGAELTTTNLTGVRMRDADLAGACFARAEFDHADLSRCDVGHADFTNASLRGAQLRTLVRFQTATWVGVDIRDVDWTGAHLLQRHIKDENYLFEMRRQGRVANLLYWLWWATSDCGRSIGRWMSWSTAITMVFAIVYSHQDIDWGTNITVFTPMYFSIVTMTTLGYGDIVPVSIWAQITTTIQVLMGYAALGGLLSIASNKMARRAD